MGIPNEERLRRWRLVLGQDSADALDFQIKGDDLRMDRALEALYDSDRSAGLGGSNPNVNRWLGDIRTYFPTSTVRVMQRDALERLNLESMLLEPELLSQIEPDIHLVGVLLSLNRVIPDKTKETARDVVRKVVRELEKKLAAKTVRTIRGSLNRVHRTRRPRHGEIDWDRTIRANLKHFIPDKRTIIPERLIGHGRHARRQAALQDVILCVDQSGSMASSVVYSSVFAAVLASMSALRTSLVVFDTSVVDLTDHLQDPVEVLFGTQLGGGTDIHRALAYCERLVTRPRQTVLVLITDLFEGGDARKMLRLAAGLVKSGVTMVCLLALNDEGAPCFDKQMAARMAALGVPTFSCTPDLFPGLMAAAIEKQDLHLWAARHDIVAARREEE